MKQSIKFSFTFPRGRWLIAVSLLFVISSNATGWSASPRATAPRASREGLASVLQPDGTLRAGVAGSFDASGYRMEYGPNGAPRFVSQASCGTPDWDGQFGLNGPNDSVNVLAVSGNTIFVGGDFTAAGSVAANHVAKFDTTTNTWSSLSQPTVSGDVNGVNKAVYALAVSGNSVFVGGGFTTAGTNVIVFANGLAKFDLSTNTWSALKQGNGNGVNSTVTAMALSGNSLFIGGAFTTANQGGTGATPAITANRVAKFDISTNTWSTLSQGDGNGVDSVVFDLAMSGNSLFVVGDFTTANQGGTGATPAVTANRVAKFDTSTNTWSALSQGDGNGVNNTVSAVAVSGSSVFVGGDFNVVNQGGTGATPTITANRVARFDTTTNTWSALSQGNGNGVSDFDTGGASGAGSVRALAVSGNSLFVGGAFNRVNQGGAGATPSILANSVAKFDIATNTWSALSQGDGAGVDGVVGVLAVVSGNNLFIGGFIQQVNFGGTGATPAIPASYLAKFDTSTNTWNTLAGSGSGNGVNDAVRAVVVSGNNMFIGGDFTVVGTINPVTANRVAKFDTTTNTWSALSQGNGNGVNNSVFALAVIGTSVFVGGDFTTVNLGGTGATPVTTANRVAKFDTTTNTWSALSQGNGNGVNSRVEALAVIGPSLFLGGSFQTANTGGTGGTPAIVANSVAKFDSNTNTWSALSQGNGNGLNGFVHALAVSGNSVFVGGDFGQVNFGGSGATPLVNANGVAKFDTATNTWSGLSQGNGNGVSTIVRSLAATGSSLFVGGDFTTVNFGGTGGTPAINANHVAKFDTSTNTWSALSQGNGNGVNTSTVLALAVSDTGVFVGGLFTTANLGGTGATPAIKANNVAKFDTATNTWSALTGSSADNGVSQQFGNPTGNAFVNALAVRDCDLFVGGNFVIAGNKASQCIARYGAPTSTPTPTPGKLLNIATRLRVQSGENVLIGGFIITGSDPKKVIIRGIGPSLAQFLSGTLSDPTLELFQGNTSLASNNDWKESQVEVEATGIQPSNDLESAIVRTLAPGSYTAILRGNNGSTGIAVVEAYDLDQSANSTLANIATRGFVEADNNVMIGGLIVGPAAGPSAKVVVRAIGPSLTNFGIAGVLQDPTLELVDVNGVTLRSNNDWKDSQQTEIEAAGLPPSDTREAALIHTLAPGNYTAVVRGVGNTTGVGLVEVYNLQ